MEERALPFTALSFLHDKETAESQASGLISLGVEGGVGGWGKRDSSLLPETTAHWILDLCVHPSEQGQEGQERGWPGQPAPL